MSGYNDIMEMVTLHGTVVRITIIKAEGSTPRGVGTTMTVTGDSFSGTIGGGTLEFEALIAARELLSGKNTEPWARDVRDYPLGPSLGQCCGGYIRLMFETISEYEAPTLTNARDSMLAVRAIQAGQATRFIQHRTDDSDHWPLPVRRAVREMQSGIQIRQATLINDWFIEPLGTERTALFLYGAGHVGRAVVKALADLPFEIFWVDTATARYPEDVSKAIHKLVAVDPAEVANHAPQDAFHVVMSYSHAIDFDVCRAVLARNNFAYLGVIASKTKRVRFVKRLLQEGIPQSTVSRLNAPIGLTGITGKEPAIIALSLAADLVLRLQENQSITSLTDLNLNKDQLGERP
jgi:xanthine dehydrogenase accessory factor